MTLMQNSKRIAACIAACIALCVAPFSLDAKKRATRASSGQSFDYFLLVLSYAPDFCAQAAGQKDPQECGKGRKLSFVVHGLWPQAESGRGPENCGGSPLNSNLIQPMLAYIPSESLIRHEWSTHGTCTGSTASDYFAQVRKARDAVKLPEDLSAPTGQLSLSPGEIEAKFQAANSTYPAESFRTSCYNDGELQEVRICLQKDLKPRSCPVSVHDCARPIVNLLPVR